MSVIDNKECKKEIGAKGNSIPLVNLLLDNEISIKGKVISRKKKNASIKLLNKSTKWTGNRKMPE